MKRICFVITDAVSFNCLMRGQLEYLKNRGYDLTLVCGGSKEQLEQLRKRQVGKIKFIPFSRKISILKDIYCLIKLWKFLLINRFDSVVYSTPKALLLASIASFLSLSEYRVCLFRGRVYENYKGKKYKFFSLLDKISIGLSNKVVFISSSLKDKYIEDGLVCPLKATLVANGSSNGVDINCIDTPNFTVLKEKIKNEIDYRDNDFIVVFIARHCVDKGIEQWVDIVNKLKNEKHIKFVSAGSIEDDISKKIIKLLSKENNYFYLNQLDSVYPLLMIADLHLFLSHREGFGNVAIEAALSGVPTFAYDVTGVRDSVNQKSGRLFSFLETKEIADEIKHLYQERCIEEHFNSSEMQCWAIENFEQTYVWGEYEKVYSRAN
ncbi:glycosyltransferase [Vibrio diabolicus]|uniref:glycosyltransferase n=1 Tax=Vibrio diabolicus TaxID=50719 RepID=UPI002160031B|nr:glycosyltransferase [Vibrio diabolicus]EIZ0309216.1 glycosyltransferase [Vibrio parahaemolyticus]ELI5429781.1 glycosyltransferase [Vibrio parahaemolyticus]MCS0337374.1 glycosyltransferase [Vibrio diabolicus]